MAITNTQNQMSSNQGAPPPPPAFVEQVPQSSTSYKEMPKATEYELLMRGNVLAAIENGEAIPNFDRLFTRFVLNVPPDESLFVTERTPRTMGKEATHIPIHNVLQLLDMTFDSWSVVEHSIVPVTAYTKQGNKPKVVFSVVLEVVYPITGTIRRMAGATDSDMTQAMASEASLSIAIKNAAVKLGKLFGTRAVYSGDVEAFDTEQTIVATATAAKAQNI